MGDKLRIDPQEREEKARENIESLNSEIQTMTKTIEEYIAGAEDITLMQARKDKEELVMQVQNLTEDVKRLMEEAEGHSQQIETLRGRGDELEEKNSRLKNELQAKTNALNREMRRKERSEREVKSLRAANDQAEERLVVKTVELSAKTSIDARCAVSVNLDLTRRANSGSTALETLKTNRLFIDLPHHSTHECKR